jgi:hypothetical protein
VASAGESKFEPFLTEGQLPSPPTAILAAGNHLWVGGELYLKLVDLNQRRLIKSFATTESRIDDLRIAGDKLWMLADQRLYLVALSAIE